MISAIIILALGCNQAVIDHKKAGIDYLGRQMLDSAQWHFSQHVKLHPEDFETRYELGTVLESLGRMNEAKAVMERLVDEKGASCDIRRESAMTCGRILEYQPRLDSSLFFYYRAYHLNEECPEDNKAAGFIYLLITQVHQRAGNLPGALVSVDSAIALGIPLGMAATTKGELLTMLNRFSAADSVFQMGLEASAQDSSKRQSIYAAMARSALKQGNQHAACSLYVTAKQWGYPAAIPDLESICK